MNIKLSKRLDTIVSMCDFCDTIIDVGTDHGKVPISIANLGKANNVIATDIRKEPLISCNNNAKLYLKNDKVNFKTIVCDGLTDIDKKLECGIIISGMGYDLIKKILKDIKEYNFKYLIISPHTKINDFVVFITDMGLQVIEERTVYEDNKAYFIFKIIREG